MKKITLLFTLFLAMASWSYSQCTTITGNNYGNLVPFNDGSVETIATDNWPNAEYSAIEDLIPGNDYTVTATNTTSMYITIAEIDWDAPALGGTVLVHGASTVTFTATTVDVIIHWHLDASCATQASDDTLTTIQCTSASCSCTATVAPGIVTSPTPTDTLMDVAIDETNNNAVAIAWVPSAFGEPALSYNIYLGDSPTTLNLIGNTANETVNITGMDFSTLYYWRIDPVNCFGSATGTVWSFTTTACTATAAPNAATTPSPAIMAIDVPIDTSAAPTLTVSPFTWVDALTGEPADSYNWTFGLTTTGDDIGGLDDFASGGGVNFGWEYNTTYYWKVDAVNCFGTTTGTVWSFTTETLPGDICTDPIPLMLGTTVNVDTSLASDSGVAAGSCGAAGADQDIWFSFVGPTSGQVDITTDADHVVIYTSCGSVELACVSNGVTVPGLTDGTTYYLRVYNNGIAARIAGPVALTVTEASLSTTDFNTQSFSVYPNPAKDIISIKTDAVISNVDIYNQLGQRVIQVNADALIDNTININELNVGIYFMKISSEGKQQTIKFIKK